MFTKVSDSNNKKITIYFEDEPVEVEEGMTVAAAVLEPSHGWTRTTHGGHKRGAFCHMGVCHECLMTIDGVPNQQACLTPVADGMKVYRQNGEPDFHQEEGKHA
ncbi:(2Fe-2S)-binding protein [Pseudodesulfovibrio sp. JC047]|uniref:(2Fe-2S)-binding protein n=1 Tax=Pseudodesulfovibrio sp. JC047 TaxID=2683199 RepID=UPI0013D7A5FD|nr:(2Fe-2S)-binding protein [Pseudodesulfovibrio sp. JC047]NDV19483.1 (2Fe-2S)-binding protein [Pseudodesulfovibrio sp. JC047]